MDNDSPSARVERTFWAVWYYISGAVSRFFRPEPTNIVRNDLNSFPEFIPDSEPANCGHAEGNTSRREVNEEQPLTTVSALSSSQPLVAWEVCTTEIDLVPDEESMQLGRGSESKAPDEREGTRKEWFVQAGNDNPWLLIAEDAKEDEPEENRVQKLYTLGRDEMQDNDKYVENLSLRHTGDGMRENMEESRIKAGAEQKTETAMTANDHQKLNETITNIQVRREDDEIYRVDEQDLKAGDTEVQLCTITYLSQEEKDDLYIEEKSVQRNKANIVLMHEEVKDSDGMLLLPSENKNKSDEVAKQAENQLSVCEELSDDLRDFKEDPSFSSLHVKLQMADDKSSTVSEDEVNVEREHVIAYSQESDRFQDAKDKDDESTRDNEEQGAVTEEENVNEAANNQTMDEVPKQEESIKLVTEDSQKEAILTGHGTCSEDTVQNPEAELHTVEFTDGGQEDMAEDTEVQRETDDVETEGHGKGMDGQSDMTTTDIPVEERFFDKDQVEEERPSNEAGNKESYLRVACTNKSVTVKPESETEQEISGAFKNIPLEICEGRLVVVQELNSPTCDETREGVPEYNNESGPDENTTQRFLEVGHCKEVKATQLPEEVESNELESLDNSGCSSRADYSPVREHMEEERECSENIKDGFDLVVEEHAGILFPSDARLPQATETSLVEPIMQESGVSFEEDEGKLLVDSIETEIEHSEKEFEVLVGLTVESDKKTKEVQDGTEELLVEFVTDEGLSDFKDADAAVIGLETTGAVAAEEDENLKFPQDEVQKMTEMNFFQESVDAINSEQHSDRTPSLLEDFTKSGFLTQSVDSEPKLLKDSTVEMQNAGIDMEETGYGFKEEEAEDKVQNKNEMEIQDLQVPEMAAELTTEENEKENTLIAESESHETQKQVSDEALIISNEDTEAADESMTSESKPRDLIVISAEEMPKHVTESEGIYSEERVVSGRQNLIDEEILDLSIQMTLSENTDGIKQQEGPEPGQQVNTEIEPSNEERDEISAVQTDKDKESKTGESELVSDTDISSSKAESGFSDQHSTGLFQGIHDTLANMSESADVSELSTQQPNFASEDILMEETAQTGQSYVKEDESVTETGLYPDSEIEHPNQESDKSQNKMNEETISQTEIDYEVTDLARKTERKDIEEASVESLTEKSSLFKVEEIKVEDEPLEITLSDSPEEVPHADSGQSRGSSEASLEEGIVSMESGSQEDTSTESEEMLLKLPSLDKPQPEWSEDVDSLPEPNRAEVAQQSTTESEDQMEVNASVLDFTAQRSRIAVKNPRVRPPKDPRSLLHMPSVDPTPSSHLPVKVPAGVPLVGLGLGIKLPGLGAGFPVLKKTQQLVSNENSQETPSEEPEKKPEEKSDNPKEDEAQQKPKWMPPRHPGFGNPLMSELKTKLKKTTKE